MNNTKTKILVDCHVFDGTLQGTTTYLKGIYTELIKEQDKEFFLVSKNPKNLQLIFGNHSNVFYLKYTSKNKFYRLIIELPKLIKKHNIDFAHFQYIVPPIKRCKYIVTIHDVLFIDFPEYFPKGNRIKNKFLYKWSAKFSDILVTVSNYSKQQISKHFNINDLLITTNAVEDVFFENYNKKEIATIVKDTYGLSNYLIYVSRWEPRKNHHRLLKSFVKLQLYKDYQLLFIGEDTFENKEYNNYFQALDPNIKERIVNFKKVDFESMLLLLRGASVSIYPSIAEGFGIPPLESIAAKIPTIASNATAMADFDFLSQHSFDPMNEKELEQQLLKAFTINDSELELLKEKVRKKYSWKNAAITLNQAITANKKGFN